MATEVDHIQPLINGGSMWDPDNHQSLCSLHHADKTAAENGLRRFGKAPAPKGCNAQGWPVAWRDS